MTLMINKFGLILRKDVYPYEYMGSWEKLNKTQLLPKLELYSNLNIQHINDAEYKHA